jgi:hypothetical protein
MQCANSSYVQVHPEMAKLIEVPQAYDCERNVAIMALRLMYGELIDVNVNKWLTK